MYALTQPAVEAVTSARPIGIVDAQLEFKFSNHFRRANTAKVMKTYFNHRSLLFVLIPGFVSILSCTVPAQTFTTLHSFAPLSVYLSNEGGANPNAGLTLSGNTLFGTAFSGGRGSGTLFALNADGSDFAVLHQFMSPVYTAGDPTNSDGVGPRYPVLQGQTLFGTTFSGGIGTGGTIFKVNADGTGFTILHSFNRTNEGAGPYGRMVLSGNTLYGTLTIGGSLGSASEGAVFAINTDGTGFRELHIFTGNVGYFGGTNSDGAYPFGGLLLSGTTLFGTALGGTWGNGTVFKLNTDGTGFIVLHNFSAYSGWILDVAVNSDGAYPVADLALSGNSLYGTAFYGGKFGQGAVFRLNTDGTGFTNLHSFTSLPYPGLDTPSNTNADGARPGRGLVVLGNTLYGTANQGGISDNGTVFALTTEGMGFRILHNFTAFDSQGRNSDGARPGSDLTVSGTTLYGATTQGGTGGSGTLFSILLPVTPPQISCGGPLVLECTNGGAVATIEANVLDPGSNSVVIVWTIDGSPYQTNTIPPEGAAASTNLTFTASFPLGVHSVTVSASNGETAPVTCSTTVQVQDTIPPQILSLSATPNLLWPPNHRMVPVMINAQAVDNCGPTTCKIVSVTSNDTAGSSGGDDWLITENLSVDLRAERLGRNHDRTYTITIECDDLAGNASFASVTVKVP
jgi:uncharacterized repeat protein (TIGR03803 family)